MGLDLVVDVLTEVFYTVLIILLPILGASMVFGLLISVFQAATSIQEMTLTFVPKIIITGIAIILMLRFMATKMIDITTKMFNIFVTVLQ
jgi:flagellar biosynthetic protein FliQ